MEIGPAWLAVVVIRAAQFAITCLPPLQAVFATEAVRFFDRIIVVYLGIALFAIIEIENQLRLRMQAT